MTRMFKVKCVRICQNPRLSNGSRLKSVAQSVVQATACLSTPGLKHSSNLLEYLYTESHGGEKLQVNPRRLCNNELRVSSRPVKQSKQRGYGTNIERRKGSPQIWRESRLIRRSRLRRLNKRREARRRSRKKDAKIKQLAMAMVLLAKKAYLPSRSTIMPLNDSKNKEQTAQGGLSLDAAAKTPITRQILSTGGAIESRWNGMSVKNQSTPANITQALLSPSAITSPSKATTLGVDALGEMTASEAKTTTKAPCSSVHILSPAFVIKGGNNSAELPFSDTKGGAEIFQGILHSQDEFILRAAPPPPNRTATTILIDKTAEHLRSSIPSKVSIASSRELAAVSSNRFNAGLPKLDSLFQIIFLDMCTDDNIFKTLKNQGVEGVEPFRSWMPLIREFCSATDLRLQHDILASVAKTDKPETVFELLTAFFELQNIKNPPGERFEKIPLTEQAGEFLKDLLSYWRPNGKLAMLQAEKGVLTQWPYRKLSLHDWDRGVQELIYVGAPEYGAEDLNVEQSILCNAEVREHPNAVPRPAKRRFILKNVIWLSHDNSLHVSRPSSLSQFVSRTRKGVFTFRPEKATVLWAKYVCDTPPSRGNTAFTDTAVDGAAGTAVPIDLGFSSAWKQKFEEFIAAMTEKR